MTRQKAVSRNTMPWEKVIRMGYFLRRVRLFLRFAMGYFRLVLGAKVGRPEFLPPLLP